MSGGVVGVLMAPSRGALKLARQHPIVGLALVATAIGGVVGGWVAWRFSSAGLARPVVALRPEKLPRPVGRGGRSAFGLVPLLFQGLANRIVRYLVRRAVVGQISRRFAR